MYTLYVNFINTVQFTFTQENNNEYCDSWNTIIKLSCSCCLQLFIILSCTIAVGTNLSQFICIGRFTAVTFQVLGHMKTILVLILGFIFFGKEGLNLHVVLGMIIAIAGMVWYGSASSKPGGKERRSFSLPKTQDYSSLPVSSEPDTKEQKIIETNQRKSDETSGELHEKNQVPIRRAGSFSLYQE